MTDVTFPPSFAWGAATAAFQIEGGADEGGKGLSIWDAFARAPGRIKTGEDGRNGAGHFYKWRADVKLMAQMGLKYYRFSISWPRVIPAGTGAVNEEGIKFYSNLIDDLLRNGIHPVVTLYHWDLPLPLQLERDGWLSLQTASAFVAYANLCFERFGPKVRHWITINEPAVHAVYGYGRGEHAPGRAVAPTKEPYLAVHHMLLAHAYTVARYRRSFAKSQQGLISIALNSDWREPLSSSTADIYAAQRSMEFNLGWLADPLYFGDYPPSMRETLGARLPAFTPEQSRLLRNSTDFFALQHYSTLMVSARPASQPLSEDSFYKDEGVQWHPTIGASKNMLGWDVAPFGIYKLARWVSQRYAPAGGIVVTESGLPLEEKTAEEARRDVARVCYIKQYTQQLSRAMAEGVDVRGYFVWSLMDNFEWREGTTPRFGLVWVDYATMQRVPKGSAAFFARLAQRSSFSYSPSECNASASVIAQFQQEAQQLQQILNASATKRSPAVLRNLALRTARLAVIAEMQVRYEAQQGEFELMRTWAEKAQKLKDGASRQQEHLRQLAAQARAQQQAQQEEEAEQPQQAEQSQSLQSSLDLDQSSDMDADLLASLPEISMDDGGGPIGGASSETAADEADAQGGSENVMQVDVTGAGFTVADS